MESTDDSEKNFFKYVFNFDDKSKSDMLNIIQYTLISIIPIVLLNKTMQKYVPESDDKKSSLELLAEIVLQVIGMFIGLLFIHRIVTFVPTYSGLNYPEYNIIVNILAILIITLSLQTKLGEKVSVLSDRLMELWDGKPSNKKNKKNSSSNGSENDAQTSAPQNNYNMVSSSQQMGGGYNDGTSINSLPNSTQQLPNYDNMVRNDNNPLVNAATPGMSEGFAPMAASEFLGGSFGSSW